MMHPLRKPEPLRAMLAAGRHPLDKGRVCEVAQIVAQQPRRLASLMECLWDEDPGIASRAADVMERLTAGSAPQVHPQRLTPWKDALLGLISDAGPKKLRWNLALTIPRMKLTVAEARRAADGFNASLDDSSSILKTAAMQGLAELTAHDPTMLPGIVDLLRMLSRSGTPAMRARGRILLKKLEAHPRKTPRTGAGLPLVD